MEHGFFHPEFGYWQTNSTPDDALLATYPEGTVEIPLKPGPNFDWDGDAWQELPAPSLPAPGLLPLQFLERFTEEEQLAVVTAAMAVPQIKLFYDKLLAASEVRQDDPRLIAGMSALVSAGLLTDQRRSEILNWS